MTWSYALTPKPQPRAALSPSEKRDSILRAVRAPMVLDSLTKARYDSTALATAKRLLTPLPAFNTAGFPAGRGGGGGGGGRGGAGACERPLTMWETFCARPAEAVATAAGGRGGAAGAAAGGEGGGAPPGEAVAGAFAAAAGGAGGRGGAAAPGAEALVAKIFALIGLPVPAPAGGRGGGGGGFGGGRQSAATTGDYSVVLTVGGTTMKTKLRVENMGAGDTGSPFGPASGDEDEDHRPAKAKRQ